MPGFLLTLVHARRSPTDQDVCSIVGSCEKTKSAAILERTWILAHILVSVTLTRFC